MRAAAACAAVVLALAAAPARAQPAPKTDKVARVVLRWKPVDGASGYELQIATDGKFQTVVAQERVKEPVFRWPLPTAPHWWRVRSFDADDRPGVWSPPQQVAFEPPTPVAVSPADGAKLPCGDGVTLGFAPDPLVQEWVVEVAETADFAGSVVTRSATPSVVLGVLPPGPRWWRATAVDLRGRTGAVSAPRRLAVVVPAPVLTASPPAESRVGDPVTLAWTRSACAVSHVVEVGLDGAAAKRSSTKDTQVSVPLPRTGTWRLRVAAVDKGGQQSGWAEAVVLAELPAPQGPAAAAIDGGFRLSWTPVAGAAAYRVSLAPAQSPDAGRVEPVTAPPYDVTGLSPPGLWLWTVAAVEASGFSGLATTPRTLTVARPAGAAPLVLREPTWRGAPLALADGGVEVAWDAVPGAALYELEHDGVSSARAPTASRVVDVTAPRTTFRVRALGPEGERSDWSRELVLERAAGAAEKPASAGSALLAVHAGVLTNFGAVLFPSPTVELAYRPPLDGRWLTVGVRGGFYRTAAQARVGELAADADATVFSVSALLSWVRAAGALRVRLGLGPGAQVAWLTSAGDRSLTVVPSVEAVASAGLAVGPGVLDLELGGLYGRLDVPAARLHAGGVALRVGYTLELPRVSW